MANHLQFNFQDATSPLMQELVKFHDHSLTILFFISALILYILMMTSLSKLTNKNILDSQEIEMVWTVIPAFILIMLALPSIQILYLMDEIASPDITIKTVGHQWYWTYEFSDLSKESEIESYMLPTADLQKGDFRLLEVDNRISVPMDSKIRMLITSEDVLHAWTLPSMGIKVDAVPGRLNQVTFSSSLPGLFFGQCSEICGANHSFMPITMEVIPLKTFESWIIKLSL
nr:cytochrome oxidase II [Myxine glutinosa]